MPVRCLPLLEQHSKSISIFPGRQSSKQVWHLQKAFCWVLCPRWNTKYSTSSGEREIYFWSSCRHGVWDILVDVQRGTHRGKFCSIWGQHHQVAHKSKNIGLSKISVVLVRYTTHFFNLLVRSFLQEYASLHCHQVIYIHFSPILLLLNPTTVSKYNREVCRAPLSLAERACILFTELFIPFDVSL